MSQPCPTRSPCVIEMADVAVTALNDSALTVLDQVNWSVRPDEFWVVAGAHHSGKSDLLLHAAALVAPAAGVCHVFGTDTREWGEARLAERLRIGFTFADGKLFQQATVAANLALPLQYHRNPPLDETARKVAALLELLELAPCADELPGNLPRVWRQRTALGRALVLQPELLVLDNPLSGLTARHRQWLLNFLDQLWRGHDFFGGRPMTLVATTEDLPAWQHPQRQFAVLHEGTFCPLGTWRGQDFVRHPAVRELLTTEPGMTAAASRPD